MDRILSKCLAAALIGGLAGAASAAPVNYLIVAPGNDSSAAVAAVIANGGTVVDDLSAIGVVVATADSANTGFAAAVANAPGVLSADPDPDILWLPEGEAAVQADLDPRAASVNGEPFSARQWNLRQIHADLTAASGHRGSGARIAVIDSGVNTGHADLSGRVDLANSKAFVSSLLYLWGRSPYEFEDDLYHGSHVACIVAGSINDFGVQGVAPEATIIAIKVLNWNRVGNWGNILRGIEYATSLGVDAINMSLGAVFDRLNGGNPGVGNFLAALDRAINHATASGALVISPAMNNGVDLNGRLFAIPAQSGNGIAVSATGPIANQDFDRLASYSNWGASVVAFAAPGGDHMLRPSTEPFIWYHDMVLSCGNQDFWGEQVNTFFFADGTSMATPHVTGVAALLVGKYGHVGPARLLELMGNSAADVLPTAFQGRGRIDAAAALQ